MLNSVDEGMRRQLLQEMEPDDRARMLSQLPDETAEALLRQLTPDERALTRKLLGYLEHSAGRIMSPEFVRLTPGMTVAEALEAIRAGEKR